MCGFEILNKGWLAAHQCGKGLPPRNVRLLLCSSLRSAFDSIRIQLVWRTDPWCCCCVGWWDLLGRPVHLEEFRCTDLALGIMTSSTLGHRQSVPCVGLGRIFLCRTFICSSIILSLRRIACSNSSGNWCWMSRNPCQARPQSCDRDVDDNVHLCNIHIWLRV